MSKRALAVLAAAAAAAGCVSSALFNISTAYYFWGPEETIEIIDRSVVAPGDRELVELERGTALLELGRYEESAAVLGRAAAALDAARAAPATDGTSDLAAPWRPESFERVLAHTLRIADALALQDARAASTAADDALRVMAEVDCERCRFDFTRFLAAVAYQAAGRTGAGLDALAAIVAHGRAEDLVADLGDDLARGVGGAEPAGFAPPPEAGPRTLVVILLLGRGPYKVKDKLVVTDGETIDWCRYLPRDPQAVSFAALDGDEPVVSVELTDVGELAVESLRDRADKVVAARGAGLPEGGGDTRHWSTLPASLQVIRVELPAAVGRVDLIYDSEDSIEIDREAIELPEGWESGPLFVTRRMP